MSGLSSMVTPLASMQSAQNQVAGQAAPKPPELTGYIQLAGNIGGRLAQCNDQLLALIGRLYGEGSNAVSDANKVPRSAGTLGELSEQMTSIVVMMDSLETLVSRLSRLA